MPKAFEVQYKRGGELRHRIVYVEDEMLAALTVLRSTWAPVELIDVAPLLSKVPATPPDWKAA